MRVIANSTSFPIRCPNPGTWANGTYLSRKVVSDALRRCIYCRPGAPNGVSIERPGPNFRRMAAQTTFDPGPGNCPVYSEPVEGPGRQP